MDFKLSHHATERALDMQLTPNQVKEVLEAPHVRHRDKTRPGTWLHRVGELTAFVADDTTVITFVWSTREAWEADIAKGSYGDREVRIPSTKR